MITPVALARRWTVTDSGGGLHQQAYLDPGLLLQRPDELPLGGEQIIDVSANALDRRYS